MLRQLFVGGAVSVCNIAIHALVMATVVQIAALMAARHTMGQSRRMVVVIISAASLATVPVLMVAHFSEVMVWSLAYAIVGAASVGADPAYFAFVTLARRRRARCRLLALIRPGHVRPARVNQTSTCFAIAKASSTSMPRNLTVPSILEFVATEWLQN